MATTKCLVGIVMGSDSDLAVMQRCAEQLKEFGAAVKDAHIEALRSVIEEPAL